MCMLALSILTQNKCISKQTKVSKLEIYASVVY